MHALRLVLLTLFGLGAALVSSTSALETKVELVQILFRHGDRTPILPYPTDPYTESTWEKYGGFGQLTQAGMHRHFDYGRFLRSRYADFLNSTYNKNRVLVRSTDYDRTLMSAYSLLAGLYEPKSYQVWNEDLKWQPIPVHTTEAANDNVFFSTPCARLEQLRKQVRETEEFKNKNSEYTDLFKILDTNSGFKNVNLDTIWTIADVIFIEKTNNLTLPTWAEENYDLIVSTGAYGFYFDFRFTEIAKLVSGGVLREMRKNILNKTQSKNSTQELYLFSGHDTYVAGLMKLLDITPNINQPPFASSVTLELRRTLTDNPSYFVQVFLKNNTITEPISYRSLTINGCEELCPLDKFLKITESLVVDNYPSACKAQIDNGLNTKLLLYFVIGSASVIVAVIIGITISTFKQIKRKSPGFRHQPL